MALAVAVKNHFFNCIIFNYGIIILRKIYWIKILIFEKLARFRNYPINNFDSNSFDNNY